MAITDTSAAQDREGTDSAPVTRLRKQYLDYLSVKRDEINEQRVARHYYHGDQWTSGQIRELKRRKQPVTTKNRVGRKIDAVVGLIERLKQDPKGYPRTPNHEDGAEIATATLRYALDVNQFDWLQSDAARQGGIDGIGGVEMDLEDGDNGDPEVALRTIDIDTFFYDPRSFKHDFSDARFMGVAKWVDLELAKEMFPEQSETLDTLVESGTDLGADQDREKKWIDSENKRIRLIDHWYKQGGEWRWCAYADNVELLSGVSPFTDEKKRTICRYIMYSANVDHDGDRYGFVRHMKSSQDEVNARTSKGLHQLNTRRIIAKRNSLKNIERVRTEAARPDGIIEWDNERPEFDDAKSQADLMGQLRFLEEAKNEIENFGPNAALIGQGVEHQSGRAIALLQQAGIAELGPYIIAYKSWKIRVYRAVWCAIQKHWTAERWIRVTDDEGLAQFLQVNGVDFDEYGRPALVNHLGSLDVDIVIDEGPDSLTVMADTFDALSAVLQSVGPMLTPPEARAAVQLLLETSPLPSSAKKAFREAGEQAQQPDPAQQEAQAIAMEGERAKVAETKSKALKNTTDAMKNSREAMMPPELQAPTLAPVPSDGGMSAAQYLS